MQDRVGSYQLIERVARGGMAEVWSARKLEGETPVGPLLCVKRLEPSLMSDVDFVEMFRDEASLVLDFDHENIVKVYELIDDGEELAMVMEYVQGPSLAKARSALESRVTKASDSAFSVTESLHIAVALCRALHHAHTRTRNGEPLRIVHRDVSPQNVLLSTDGVVKLVDFGIAKATQRLTRTRAGALKGKCSYMAPEQVRGEAVDHRADQFATGIVLWELLTGRRLFSGRNEVLILEQVARSDAVPPSSVKSGIPKSVDRLVLRALGWHPDERFPDMLAMEKALLACLEGLNTDARRPATRASMDLRGLVERAASAPVQSESGAMRTRVMANADTQEKAARNDDVARPNSDPEGAVRTRRPAPRVVRPPASDPHVTDPMAQPEHTGQFFERRRTGGSSNVVTGVLGVAIVGAGVGTAVWWAERDPAPSTRSIDAPALVLISNFDDANAQARALSTIAAACDQPCLAPLLQQASESKKAAALPEPIASHVAAVVLDQCLAQCNVAGSGQYQPPAAEQLEQVVRAASDHPCRTEIIDDIGEARVLPLLARAALADAVDQCVRDAKFTTTWRQQTSNPQLRLQVPTWPKNKKRTAGVIRARTAELVRRGQLASTLGEAERAKSLLVEALDHEPERVELHERIGNAFRALGDPAGAAYHYRLYFHAHPDDPDRARADQYARRYGHSATLTPRDPPSPDERAVRVHRLIGDAATQSSADALPLLQRALELAPNDVVVLERLAAVYLLLERQSDARATLEHAVKLKPTKRLREQLKAVASSGV